VVLPAAVLWGASFPLALAAVAAPRQDPGRLVGGVFAANTVGAALGAAGSFWLIGQWGTQRTQQLLIAVSAANALLLLVSLGPVSAGAWRPRKKLAWGVGRVLALAGLAVVAVSLAAGVAETPWELLGYGRYASRPKAVGPQGAEELLFLGEGANVSVAVSRRADTGVRSLHVSGRAETSTEPEDLRRRRLLGHLPALVHPGPRSVLVIGCGTGITAGAFALHPGIERIVICEPEPLVLEAAARHFARENYDVLHDRRVEVVPDDPRHFIRTARGSFDVIVLDPPLPSAKGAAALYTHEFLLQCRERLKSGGVLAQYLSLDQSDADLVKCEVMTFLKSNYVEGTVWGDSIGGRPRGLIVLCQYPPFCYPIYINAVKRRLQQPDHARVLESLGSDVCRDELDVLQTYCCLAKNLQPWLGLEFEVDPGSQLVNQARVDHDDYSGVRWPERPAVNSDRRLCLQYLAGLTLNQHQSEALYHELIRYRRFDESVFQCPPQTRLELMRRWDRTMSVAVRGR
jgi:spermidine synthase